MPDVDTERFRTPGQLMKALMAERGWTQQVLGNVLGLHVTAINHLANGRRPVTPELALALGEVFSIAPDEFIRLQRDYDLNKARIEQSPDPGRATRAHLFGELPIVEMMRRGWIQVDDIRDVPGVEQAVARFFGVDSPEKIEILPHTAKKTETSMPATPAQLAWVYRVKQISSDMLVGRYSPIGVRAAVSKLGNLLGAPESARRVPRILSDCGIRYAIVETLPKAKIDGVCFWFDDASPVIGMSFRFDRIDNFWFVLRHELEHVLRRHGQTAVMLDAELEEGRGNAGDGILDEERLANEAASEFCVPQETLEKFVSRKAPFFRDQDLVGLANTLHVHPGLVAGQLQHRIGRYDRFRQHLASIRFAVAPNAMVDGWGDVAPVDQ